jgi:hypothetical protein
MLKLIIGNYGGRESLSGTTCKPCYLWISA